MHAVSKAHDGASIRALHLEVRSRHLLTGGDDHTIRLWDAAGAFRGADLAQVSLVDDFYVIGQELFHQQFDCFMNNLIFYFINNLIVYFIINLIVSSSI